MPPSTSIQPIQLADLPTLAAFLHSSKLSLTINRLLFNDWPNDAAQKPLYTAAVESGFKDPSCESLKVVDHGSGEIIAHLALSRKQPVNATERDAVKGKEEEYVKSKIPNGLNPAVLSAVLNAVTTIAKEMEGIDHFEVKYICVKSKYRRSGIGSQLLGICFDRAKAEGLPLAVCAEPAAYEFFAKLGFRETKHVDIDLREYAEKLSGFGVFRLSGMLWDGKTDVSCI